MHRQDVGKTLNQICAHCALNDVSVSSEVDQRVTCQMSLAASVFGGTHAGTYVNLHSQGTHGPERRQLARLAPDTMAR
jgi:hypothetical protein